MKWTNRDEVPPTLPVDPDGIPYSLKLGKQLVLWRWEWRGDTWTKVPYQANGRKASSTDPETWTTWDEAWAAYATGKYSGVGRVLNGQGVVCIDLDDCRVGDGVNEQAQELMDRFESYAEWSPTVTGVHIWVAGTWPTKGNKDPKRNIEVYADGRYITLSGAQAGYQDGVHARPADLATMHRELTGPKVNHRITQVTGAPPEDEPTEAPADVQKIIDRALNCNSGDKFARLMAGDISDYPSESEADAGLASLITFWTQDPALILGVLQESKLWDDKWEREDYQERTIGRALNRTDIFTERESVEHFEPAPAPTPPRFRTAAFPLHALPPVLRRWSCAVAESLDTAPEAVATFAFSAISGAVGNSYAISPKGGWTETAAVWTCLVAAPGVAKKTPTLAKVNAPMWRVQGERSRLWKADMRKYQDDLDEWQKTPRDERGERPQPPIYPHVIVSDVTMEKLAAILGENPRGLLQERDELRGWVAGMNQYKARGGGADRQHYLEMWNGQHMKVDRLNRPDPIIVPRAFVAMMGTIQPDMVNQLRDDQGDDGLFYRFLWCWPEGLEPSDWSETEPDTDTLRSYDRLIRNLLELEPVWDDETASIRPHIAHLAPDAKPIWAGRYNAHQARMRADMSRGELYAKTPGHAARLALLHHLIRFQTTGAVIDDRYVDEESVNAGWDLAEWYQDQCAKVMGEAATKPEDRTAMRILEWMTRKDLTEVKATDIVRYKVAGINRTTIAVAALQGLADMGFGTIKTEKVTGGKRVVFLRMRSTIERIDQESDGEGWQPQIIGNE